ncbi:hypothetical protein FHR90_000188 [Endobacter medicaginis]|jgi:hypothetical protein|uniref:2OG-Fe(II) oxygenase n=1 Tax=Endobacter medicaginis TaxID=1181271 RepID=A0A850NNW2_9PROT|nr:2OG-Fe(II) oxygenase [Endobacter medicaginis]MBB3172382.1 hypothetical protein [Endobacter medicaginis]MCX5474128.1 2OG-Fe(II) oxygenase [Endobacter medicaginis]NVN29042.1 2OG-Fe(II) oxygenase [Endobacter medicaginis]
MTMGPAGNRSECGRLIDRLAYAEAHLAPFAFWTFADLLPPSLARAAHRQCLPPCATVAQLAAAHDGTRAGGMARRRFIDPTLRGRVREMDRLAGLFQHPATVAAIEALTGAALSGCLLRCELCCDGPGFWLAPHTDIGDKALTLLVYLSEGEEAADWGTDLFDGPERWFARPPAPFGSALMFVPSPVSWHGYSLRRMNDWRRTLIVNYVRPGWRNRDELAYGIAV